MKGYNPNDKYNRRRNRADRFNRVDEIKTLLINLNTKVKDKITQIKSNEVVKILPIIDKKSKIKDDDLINLLQYYGLIEELKTAHV